MTKIGLLSEKIVFPCPDQALQHPNGLLALGGDLSSERLLAAYRNGIFPWFNDGEIIQWWSPDPRMLMAVDELKISRSLAQALRRDDYQIRQNSDFAAVIYHCAKVKRNYTDGTWIESSMQKAYNHLHQKGYAHSLEVWAAGKLVGGLYGVMLGAAYFGESMFHIRRDASKIAFCFLVKKLQQLGIKWFDCQMPTDHLASLGAKPVPRQIYLTMLQQQLAINIPADSWSAGKILSYGQYFQNNKVDK